MYNDDAYEGDGFAPALPPTTNELRDALAIAIERHDAGDAYAIDKIVDLAREICVREDRLTP